MTDLGRHSAPTPDLRIVPVSSLRPHEEHDSQRSQPLIERIRTETVMINPPLVAPMRDGEFVILDGANRFHVFSHLGYPHILVQVASYESGFVHLSNWQHAIAGWNMDKFIEQIEQIPQVRLDETEEAKPIARILSRTGDVVTVQCTAATPNAINATLCQVVSIYQRNAKLHRTASTDAEEVWTAFPDAFAQIAFPPYTPADIVAAAQQLAYLPPGISRHIVEGRALRVNYPLAALCDETLSLEQKNADLRLWMQNKLANRQVRYYAEATYQFDE